MKKTFFFLFLMSFLFAACDKDEPLVFQEDVDAQKLMRSYILPNSAPKKDVAYIKGKYNGQSFYINEGDTNFPAFVISKVDITETTTGSVTIGGNDGGQFTSLQIRIGNHLDFSMPTIHVRTFPQKGNIALTNLWDRHVVVKDFPIDRINNAEAEGWLVDLVYPRPSGELEKVGNPVATSFYKDKPQSSNRYFKITSIEDGDFGNGRTQKITFKFDLEMFYQHRFSPFDRIENGEMVLYV
jgi:hypothetical protein